MNSLRGALRPWDVVFYVSSLVISLTLMFPVDVNAAFSNAVTYSAGDYPQGVVYGDFDHDGDMDLASNDYNGHTVAILMNNGSGVFAAPVFYPLDLVYFVNDQSIATADLNNDSFLDLVVSRVQDKPPDQPQQVYVLLNDGDGTFAPWVGYDFPYMAMALTLADFDGNGFKDIGAAVSNTLYFSVIYNNGDGTFGAPVNTNISCRTLSSADFDGDGDIDVAAGSGNNVAMLLNTGGGNFAAPVYYPAGSMVFSVSSADFDADGDLDIVAGNMVSGNFSILLNNGNATFAAAVNYGAWAANAIRVNTGDMDNDGDVDVLVVVENSRTISIYRNNGSGVFVLGEAYGAANGIGTMPASVSVVDLDGDGDRDIVAPITDSDVVAVLMNSLITPIGVTVTQSGGATNIAEGGATDSYAVVLTSQPTNNVTITVSPNAQQTVSSSTLVFTPANWNVAKTVTVTAVNDAIAEGAHTGTVTHSAASADLNYNAIAIGSVTTNVTDNDSAGVTVTQSGGATNVAEGGVTDSYTVVLTSQPTGRVTVTVSSGAQSTISSSTLVFTSLNWNAPKNVLVRAVDDASVEGAHASTILHTATSSDGNYDGIAIGNVNVNVTDDDVAGVSVVQSASTTSFLFSASTQYAVGDAPRGMAIGDFNSDGKKDLVVANFLADTVSIFLGIGDGTFGAKTDLATANGPSATVIRDFNADGNADFAVANSGTYAVSVYLGVGNGTFGSRVDYPVDYFQRLIVASDFNSDGIIDLATASATVPSSVSVLLGLGNGAFSASVSYPVSNFPYGFVVGDLDGDGNVDIVTSNVSASSISVLMGSGEGAFGAKTDYDAGDFPYGVTMGDFDGDGDMDLATENSSSNLVSILMGIGDGTFGPRVTYPKGGATYRIASGDFNGDGVLDLATAGTNLSVLLGIGDGTFAVKESYAVGTSPMAIAMDDFNGDGKLDIATVNQDDDTISILLNNGLMAGPQSGVTNVAEGGVTDSYTVTLETKPTSDVMITITTDGQTSVSTSTLVFSSTNWMNPRIVTVTAVDDAAVEGLHTGTITHSATSADLDYNGIVIGSVTANITDNDIVSHGVNVTQSGGTTNIAEGGAIDSYTVVLTSQPTNNVTVTVSPNAQQTVSSSTLVFTPANWNVAKTVTVTAVNDAIAEGAHTGTITHSAVSADLNYNAIAIGSVTTNVTDNDAAGVNVTQSGGTTNIAEGGATDSYTVVLTSQPTNNVTVTVSPNAQQTVSSSTLVFTPANWNVAKTVTVTAVNDAIAEGAHTGTITHSAVSADLNYNAIAIGSVTTNVTDNDAAGVTVTQSGGTTNITEGGATDSYTVVLNSQPTNSVTITVSPNAQQTVSSSTLVFTPANWNVAKTVTVMAVDDAIVEGAHFGTTTHAAVSADLGYNGIVISGVTANITDNDSVGVTVTQSGGATDVAEGGVTDSYTLVLDTAPSSNVTVTVSSDAQSTVSSSTLVFTPANWNVAKTVTVTAVDDVVVEGAHAGTVTHTAVSVDADYDAIAIGTVTVNITDDDVSGSPATSSISPSAKLVGSAQFVMTVNGSDFVAASVVRIDGSDRVTTYVSASQLTAVIPASDMSATGTHSITVFNPAPGGGVSNAQTFIVSPLGPVIVTVPTLPTVITNGYFTPATSTPATSTTDVTVQAEVILQIATGSGTSTVDIPGGTVITRTDNGLLDATAITASYPENLSLAGLDTYTVILGKLRWGIPNLGLSFSNPVTLRIFVGSSYNGRTLIIQRSVAGARWTVSGIVTPGTCTVVGGFCTFQTLKASDFIAYYVATTAGGGGGGGGGGGETFTTPITVTSAESVGRSARVAVLPVPVHSLVKLPDDRNAKTQEDSAVYYVGADGYRHAFPSDRIYATWYCDFSSVQTVTAGQMAAISLGKNVTYRPGARMVKLMTVPDVYTVDVGGILRKVEDETQARSMYGQEWNKSIDDISDALFMDYKLALTSSASGSYVPSTVSGQVKYPSDNLGLANYAGDRLGSSFMCVAAPIVQTTLATKQNYMFPATWRFTYDIYPGSKDAIAIKYMQDFLRLQGKDIYPEGVVNGVYGPATTAAVKRFQGKYGILQTGNLGQGARGKMNDIIERGI